MWYGDKRESVCNLGYALEVAGWKLYGVKADESDSMTDYYSPARWDGIATKNGFTLVVDNPTLSYSGHEVQRRVSNSATVNTQDLYSRIEKLQNMTTDRGASQQEEETAKAAIEKLQAKIKENSRIVWEVVDVYPTFKNANPENYNWHIEDQNGIIIAMGSGAFQFAFTSWMWDFENKKPNRTVTESTQEKVTAMYKLVDKIEKAINNPKTCMIQKEVKTIKKVLAAVKIDSLELPKEGMNIKLNTGFTNVGRKGDVYKIYNSDSKSFFAHKYNGKLNKVLTGQTTGNKIWMNTESFVKALAKGSIEIVDIKEVEQVETAIKWTKEKYNYSPEVNEEMLINTNEPTETISEQKETVKADYTYVITEDTDTRDNSLIYLVKVEEKLSREEYKELAQMIKKLGGYYSRFKHAFIFKKDPSEKLGLNKVEPVAETAEPVQEVETKQAETEKETPSTEIVINEEVVEQVCKSAFKEKLDDDVNIFVHGEFASLNKNNTLEEYREAVKDSSNIEECKVTDVIVLDGCQWNIFTNSFMYDNSLIAGLGGTGSHYTPSQEYESFYKMPEHERKAWIGQAYNLVVLVINADTSESILVDPQGHNYSRYVAFTDAEEVRTLVNGYIKLYRNYKEIEALEKSINDDIEEVATVSRKIVEEAQDVQTGINQQPQEEVKEIAEEIVKESIQDDMQDKNKPSYILDVNFNKAKKGIEIKPKGQLDDDIKQKLRSNGFSWFGGRLQMYIAKDSDARREFLKGLGVAV